MGAIVQTPFPPRDRSRAGTLTLKLLFVGGVGSRRPPPRWVHTHQHNNNDLSTPRRLVSNGPELMPSLRSSNCYLRFYSRRRISEAVSSFFVWGGLDEKDWHVVCYGLLHRNVDNFGLWCWIMAHWWTDRWWFIEWRKKEIGNKLALRESRKVLASK